MRKKHKAYREKSAHPVTPQYEEETMKVKLTQ